MERSHPQRLKMNIIEFVESPHKLTLYPVQKFILKAAYNVPLEDKARCILVPKSWRYVNSAKAEHYYNFTEVEYMQYLFQEGRCNIKDLDHNRQDLVFPLGRRTGKTVLSSIISSYETYRLLRKDNPQRHYGIREGASISLSTITCTKDQRDILSKMVRDFFECDFFKTYISLDASNQVKFQTPHDFDKTGRDGDSSLELNFLHSSLPLNGMPHTNFAVILDDITFVKDENALYQVVLPTIEAFAPSVVSEELKSSQDLYRRPPQSEGRIISIATPRHKVGMFYNKYELSKRSEEILMIQAPSWEVSPHIPLEFLNRAHKSDPYLFASEYGAEFTSHHTAPDIGNDPPALEQ